MKYVSAGHHFNPNGSDPGAVAIHDGKKYLEAALARDFRNKVCAHLERAGEKYITDKDTETLGQYIARIKPGSGSVVCEFHFNASANPSATGVEVLVRTGATTAENNLAREMCEMLSCVLGLKNRGVKTEAQSHRGRLAILNDGAGISVLPELCFMSNKDDLESFLKNEDTVAAEMAALLVKYDKMYS